MISRSTIGFMQTITEVRSSCAASILFRTAVSFLERMTESRRAKFDVLAIYVCSFLCRPWQLCVLHTDVHNTAAKRRELLTERKTFLDEIFADISTVQRAGPPTGGRPRSRELGQRNWSRRSARCGPRWLTTLVPHFSDASP